MLNSRVIFSILIFFLSSVITVSSIKCYHCYPPMDEDLCKRQNKMIDCHDFKPLGYDSCIKVDYNGNNTVSKTCYRGFLCEGAKDWCKFYGPCTVSCCTRNKCNTSNVTQFSAKMVTLLILVYMTL